MKSLSLKTITSAALMSLFGFVSLPTTKVVVLGVGATIVMSEAAFANGKPIGGVGVRPCKCCNAPPSCNARVKNNNGGKKARAQ